MSYENKSPLDEVDDFILWLRENELETPNLFSYGESMDWGLRVWQRVSAELERVKAELKDVNDAFDDCIHHKNITIDEISAELTSLRSRLPVNADGDVVLWGEKIPYRNHLDKTGGTCVGTVERIQLNDSPNKYKGSHVLFMSPQREWIGCEDCYSSVESCRAAAEGGGE